MSICLIVHSAKDTQEPAAVSPNVEVFQCGAELCASRRSSVAPAASLA